MASKRARWTICRKYDAVVISAFLNRMSMLASVYISKTCYADQALSTPANPPTATFWAKVKGKQKKKKRKIKSQTYTAIHSPDS